MFISQYQFVTKFSHPLCSTLDSLRRNRYLAKRRNEINKNGKCLWENVCTILPWLLNQWPKSVMCDCNNYKIPKKTKPLLWLWQCLSLISCTHRKIHKPTTKKKIKCVFVLIAESNLYFAYTQCMFTNLFTQYLNWVYVFFSPLLVPFFFAGT